MQRKKVTPSHKNDNRVCRSIDHGLLTMDPRGFSPSSTRGGVSSTKAERGFVLLFAVLISGILLAIGAAIFNITIKEVDLSASARESQFALYAADSGTECALYWDLQQDAFNNTDPNDSITCLDNSWEVTHTAISGGMEHAFEISFTPERPYCATVVVTKRDGPPEQTSIRSRGYNTCDADTRRRVERALEVNF